MTAVRTVPQEILRPRRASPGEPPSLSTAVRRNALWNMAATVLLRLSGVGMTAVVAHLLSPREFGVFAVATTIFAIASAIGEFGVVSCLIRADLDADVLGPTLTTVSWGSSLVMAAAMAAFARPIATALGSPAGAGPVRVMALVTVLWGVGAVPSALCIRNFKQDKLFLADALAFIPSTAVLLLLARHGSGAMAFAWSRVTGQFVSCLVVSVASPRLYRPGLARRAFSVLLTFGFPIAGANFVGNILQNVDYAFIGHLAGPVMLGTYVLAFNISSWATSLLGGVLTSVSTAAFSQVKGDKDRLGDAVISSVRAVMLVAAPTCLLVMAAARPIVLTLYGARWHGAAPVLAILSVYGLVSIMAMVFSSLLIALGQSKPVLGIQMIWLFGLIPAMTIGVREDGITGAAIAHIAIIGPVVLPCYLIAVRRCTELQMGRLARATFLPLIAAVIAAGLAWLVILQFERPMLGLAAGLAVGGISYVLMTAPQLVSVLGRGRLAHAHAKQILHFYYIAGRLLGIPLASPPRHAMRRSGRRIRTKRG